jgi:hypothetical protein
MHGCLVEMVIPGPAAGRNPESKGEPGVAFRIPGSLAALAPRNDEGER